MSTMLSQLDQHIQAEAKRWAAEHQNHNSAPSVITSSSAVSDAETIFDKSHRSQLQHSRRHMLSRRSSTSSFATEFEDEPAVPFVMPRDFNGAPITIYASLEAAVAQSTQRIEAMAVMQQQALLTFSAGASPGGAGEHFDDGGAWTWAGAGVVEAEQPRRLVTPGKLYENEEDDDEIVYS